MDSIQFADGFDAPDRLAFGLGAPQLITVVGGGLMAFALLHAPLPGALCVPLAAATAVAAATLGWLRIAGRPALEWAYFAARHALRPRSGTLDVAEVRSRAPDQGAVRAADRGPGRVTACSDPGVAIGVSPEASNIVALPRRTGADARLGSASAEAAGSRLGSGARRIVFFSLKGGTGRTTLSTEIATWCAASRARSRTVLIDCDLRSACVGGRLGMSHRGIVEFAIVPPDDRRLGDFLAVHPSGLRVLLGPTRPANPSWPVTPSLLREVLRDLDAAGADTVILDVAPELNDITRAALRAADEVLVVVMPTATGILDAYRTTEQLRRLGLRERLGYVVNRARPGVDVSVAMNDLSGVVIAEVPDDVALVDAENAHRPAVLAGTGAAAVELRRLAGRMQPPTRAAAR